MITRDPLITAAYTSLVILLLFLCKFFLSLQRRCISIVRLRAVNLKQLEHLLKAAEVSQNIVESRLAEDVLFSE